MINLEERSDTNTYEIRAIDEEFGIVALLIAQKIGFLITIEKISVNPNFKRLGIGSSLTHSLETWTVMNTNVTYIVSPLPICEADTLADISGARKFFQSRGYTTHLGIFLAKKVR